MNQNLSDKIANQLKDLGLGAVQLISSSADGEPFGDAILVFRIDSILLRVILDKGETFLDVAPVVKPRHFSSFEDVAIALGWVTLHAPEPKSTVDLSVALKLFQEHFVELLSAFASERINETQARVEIATRQRGAAFVSRLRKKAQDYARRSTKPN